MGFWFAGLYQDWLSGVDALIMGICIAVFAVVGDLFESMVKRDLRIKDSGNVFGPHGGLLDRLDALLVHDRRSATTWRVALRVLSERLGTTPRIRVPTLPRMKRVVILGATGSVGEQALEVTRARTSSPWPGLAAGRGWERTIEQARDHGVPTVALGEPRPPRAPRRPPGTAGC